MNDDDDVLTRLQRSDDRRHRASRGLRSTQLLHGSLRRSVAQVRDVLRRRAAVRPRGDRVPGAAARAQGAEPAAEAVRTVQRRAREGRRLLRHAVARHRHRRHQHRTHRVPEQVRIPSYTRSESFEVITSRPSTHGLGQRIITIICTRGLIYKAS